MISISSTAIQSEDSLSRALSSCENFVQYLNGEREIQNLARKAQHPLSITHLAYNRWSFTWLKIESASLHCVTRIFNYCKPCFIHFFPILTKQLQVKIQHKRVQHRTPYFQDLFKEQLLTRSLNSHQPESADFYLHPSINLRTRKFKDDQVEFSSFSQKRFLMLDGICQGMCDWLIYLYFHSLPYYLDSDPAIHLKSLAQVFENGAPRQSELLQLFGWAEKEVKHFMLGFEVENDKQESQDLLTIKSLKEDKTKAFSVIKNFPIGVFLISFELDSSNGHALVYFKINENLGFIFDPNIGLIKLASHDQHEDLVEKLLASTQLLRYIDDNCCFEFHRVTPKNSHEPHKTKYTIGLEQN